MSNPLFFLIYTLFEIYVFLLIVHVVMSWLIAFDVINRHSDFVQKLSYALSRLFEPALKFIRPYLPNTGAFDLSIIVLFIGVNVLEYTVRWVEYKLNLLGW